MILVASSIGTEVNSADTSYEVMISSAWSLTSWICWMKSPVFLMWWGELPTRDFKISKFQNFETPSGQFPPPHQKHRGLHPTDPRSQTPGR